MRNNEEPVTNSSQTCTDLPLSPGGNNGNEVRALDVEASTDIARLANEMFTPLPEPPLDVLDARVVREWIDRATEQLLFRRDRQELLREAMGVLEEEWRSVLRSERLREQAIRQQERLRAKQEGGYWRERDAPRSATRPVHVVVDPAAWARAKAAAALRRSSVGVVVGELVAREVRRPRRRCAVDDTETRVRLFTRLAVDGESWARVRALARAQGATVERLVGTVVEEGFRSTSPSPFLR
jgi:hypothetical protein